MSEASFSAQALGGGIVSGGIVSGGVARLRERPPNLPTVSMSSSDQQRLEKRSRIIEAAVEVFAEKGFRAARVSDIARSAGVADGTIYLYFKNKEDLLLVIFEEKMEDLLLNLQASLHGIDDPVERMRAYARHHFQSIQDRPALAQVFQVELRQSHRFLREYRPEKLWQYLGVFGELVRDGQDHGVIRDDVDPFLAQWAFFGALDEISIQWVLARKRERFNLDHAAQQVVDIFLRGMVPTVSRSSSAGPVGATQAPGEGSEGSSTHAPSTPSATAEGRRSS